MSLFERPSADARQPGAEFRSPAPGVVDPDALLRISSLELRVRGVMDGLRTGTRRSHRRGTSLEFREFRPYAPGDDLRNLDWKRLAWSGRHYVRTYQAETNLRCVLLLDRSRSMEYGSRAVTKSDYATTLCATLAQFLIGTNEAVGLATFTETVEEFLPARASRQHLAHLFATLSKPPSGTGTDLKRSLEEVATRLSRRGVAVVITDALSPADEWVDRLRHLRAGHQVVRVLQVLDPAELDFPFSGAGRFRDVETGRTKHVDPAACRSRYQAAFAEHQATLKTACERIGVALQTCRTDEPLAETLTRFLTLRR